MCEEGKKGELPNLAVCHGNRATGGDPPREDCHGPRGVRESHGVDLSYRFTTAMGQLRRLVQSGASGEIFAAELLFHNAYGPQKPGSTLCHEL
jgi:hypothetical protein